MSAASRTRVGALSPAGFRTATVWTALPPRCSTVTGPLDDVHLRVDPGAVGAERWSDCADVLSRRAPAPVRRAEPEAARLLDRHPGCLVAAVPHTGGGCVVGVRGGSPVAVLPLTPGARPPAGWCDALASFLHAWVVSGRAVGALEAVALERSGRTLWTRVAPWRGGG